MMMKSLNIRLLENREQSLILPLLGESFPDYWEQLALSSGKMPYEEISFAAFDNDKVIGHCGIIPYRIMHDGEVFPMAGVASVAVAPEYRRQGIARELCIFAAQWAKMKNFVSMPLYTAHCRVYESAGWQILDTPQAKEIVSGKKTAALGWEKGSSLTGKEKANIIRLYNESPAFDGKILRDGSGTLHCWERIFAEPDFRFAVVPKMYAVKSGDTLIELGFDNAQTTLADRKRLFYQLGVQKLYLPETELIQELLDGVEMENISSKEVMHDEKVMFFDLENSGFHSGKELFFPITDKF